MMPTLFASWIIPVQRPRIARGVHSDTYAGTSALTIPTPRPAKNLRASNQQTYNDGFFDFTHRAKYRTLRAFALFVPRPTTAWMTLPMI